MIFVSFLDDRYSRSSVYLQPLRDSKLAIYYQVPTKFFKTLIFVLKLNREKDDVIVVMSPSHKLTLFLRLFTYKKKIILDAGWSLSEASKLRDNNKIRLIKDLILDFLSFKAANQILVESTSQLTYLSRKFRIDKSKLDVLFTGFNESNFKEKNPIMPKELKEVNLQKKRVVFFRGKYNQESGINLILDVLKEIKSHKIHFIIATNNDSIQHFNSENITVITRYLENHEIRYLYELCDISIGQMGENSRIENTVAHKVYESMYFGVPIICQDSSPHREILENQNYPLFVKGNLKRELSQLLVKCIEDEINIQELRDKITSQYKAKLSQEILSKKFIQLIK